MKYDSIIFDLDGTLWDSTEEIVSTWQKVMATDPMVDTSPTREDILGVMGLSDIDLMKKLFPSLETHDALELFDRCCVAENEYLNKFGAKSYDKICDMLRILSRTYKLFIVSNCNDGYIEAYLHSMGVSEYFTDFESFGRTRKPKSENIKLIAQRNKLLSPVYVGDTQWDRDAAEAAGVPFIFAAYGFGTTDNTVPYIYSPMELTVLLKT